MRLVLLIVLALAAAGCISVPDAATLEPAGTTPRGAPSAWIDDAFVLDHDHDDSTLHASASPSMRLLAHTAFDDLAPTVIFGEADLLGDDHMVLASFVGGGFVIADVSDPAAPRGVSFTPDPGMEGDVKSSESGNFVFVGRQVGQWQGVQAYNVMLRERPVPAGFYPIAGTQPFRGGCHMLAVHGDLLYCAPNDNTVRIMRIVETAGAVILVPEGVYAPLDAPLSPVLANEERNGELTHDMTVMDDPLTGQPVMFVSFWDHGLRVVDVSDPSAPKEIGAWKGEGAEEFGTYSGAVHTAMAGLVDGRRIVVVVPEYAEVPSVTFIDATDYGAMSALGVWAPRSADEWEGSARQFSTHNFQLLDGKVYMAMNHGGVWVIDAGSAEKLAAPQAIGYLLPAQPRAVLVPGLPGFGGVPSVWDVLVKDGVILATDMGTGLYALQLDADAGKVGLTSFG